MSAKQKSNREIWAATGYEIYPDCDCRFCFYCGELAVELDHCPPIASRPVDELLPKRLHYKKWVVPACKECNRTLGAHRLPTLEDRLIFLGQIYNSRYINIPYWSTEEIMELGDNLRNQIFFRQETKKVAGTRLIHINWRLEQCTSSLQAIS